MVTRNSTTATRHSRKPVKGTPTLTAVWPDPAPRRLEFAADGFSLLGDVPKLAASLPMVRYDRAILGDRLIDLDVDGKESMIEELGNAAFTVHATIKIIGKLMAGQDRAMFPLGASEASELGFALHGLAHLAQELMQAAERIAQASPAERAAEAAHG